MIENAADITKRAQRTYPNKFEVWDKVETLNALGEIEYSYELKGVAWARIIPVNGQLQSIQVGVSEVKYSTKFVVRENSVKRLNENMHFLFKNQKYQVSHFIPNYKTGDEVEIFTTLVV